MAVELVDHCPPNQDVVETLEDLLAQAREGNVQGIAYATIGISGCSGTGWTGVMCNASFGGIGSVHYLLTRMTNSMFNVDT